MICRTTDRRFRRGPSKKAPGSRRPPPRAASSRRRFAQGPRRIRMVTGRSDAFVVIAVQYLPDAKDPPREVLGSVPCGAWMLGHPVLVSGERDPVVRAIQGPSSLPVASEDHPNVFTLGALL